jgi:hypothetical protein
VRVDCPCESLLIPRFFVVFVPTRYHALWCLSCDLSGTLHMALCKSTPRYQHVKRACSHQLPGRYIYDRHIRAHHVIPPYLGPYC